MMGQLHGNFLVPALVQRFQDPGNIFVHQLSLTGAETFVQVLADLVMAEPETGQSHVADALRVLLANEAVLPVELLGQAASRKRSSTCISFATICTVNNSP